MQPQKDERTFKQVYHSAVSGLCARLRSNYDFIYRIGKSIPAGDAYCEHIIELRPVSQVDVN
jgi:hypothetical protein